MPDPWLAWTITAVAVAVAAGMLLRPRRPQPTRTDIDPREQLLARKLARVVGCSLEQALPAVRREVDIAPHQSDETLIKRAAYHYRQDLPETTCQVYRDSSPG